MAIQVTRQIHAYACDITNRMSKILISMGYTESTAQDKLREKLGRPSVIIKMVNSAFEQGLSTEDAALSMIKTIGF